MTKLQGLRAKAARKRKVTNHCHQVDIHGVLMHRLMSENPSLGKIYRNGDPLSQYLLNHELWRWSVIFDVPDNLDWLLAEAVIFLLHERNNSSGLVTFDSLASMVRLSRQVTEIDKWLEMEEFRTDYPTLYLIGCREKRFIYKRSLPWVNQQLGLVLVSNNIWYEGQGGSEHEQIIDKAHHIMEFKDKLRKDNTVDYEARLAEVGMIIRD